MCAYIFSVIPSNVISIRQLPLYYYCIYYTLVYI